MESYKNRFEHLVEVRALVEHVLSKGKEGARQKFDSLLAKESASKIELPLVTIKKLFCLSDFEYVCLLLSVVAQMDGGMGAPSLKNALDFFGLIGIVDERAFCALSQKNRLQLLVKTSNEHCFYLKEEVYEYIFDSLDLDGGTIKLKNTHSIKGTPNLYPSECNNAITLIKKSCKPILVSIVAKKGSGRKTLAQQICADINKNALIVSFFKTEQDELSELVARVKLLSVLTNSLPIICSSSAIDYESICQIAEFCKILFVCKEANGAPSAQGSHNLLTYELVLPKLNTAKVQMLWETLAHGLNLDTRLLAERYRLSVGQIEHISKAVLSQRPIRTSEVSDMEAIAREIAKSNRDCAYARLVVPQFDFGNLVVDEKTQEKLDIVLTILRTRQRVYDQYGYSELFQYGKGIGILFYGASGTGKTMTTQALAKELGLDVLAADLSTIVDKYIGETEKHLNEIFETAQSCNCILFFDEADSLFAKRTQVTDSHDKNANTQTAYLLQRIEEFDGIVILATNLCDNIDEAFRRRLPFIIEFSRPNASLRKKLWNQFIPSKMPVGDIDFDYLADSFELTPATIKWTAFSAATTAISQGKPLSTEHILKAIEYEYVKLGAQFPKRNKKQALIIE